jgi:hypothetical protein
MNAATELEELGSRSLRESESRGDVCTDFRREVARLEGQLLELRYFAELKASMHDDAAEAAGIWARLAVVALRFKQHIFALCRERPECEDSSEAVQEIYDLATARRRELAPDIPDSFFEGMEEALTGETEPLLAEDLD